MTKPFLIIQLRPEDAAADDELRAIREYGGLRETEIERARVEHSGLPEIDIGRYSAIIVGGSPFDVSTAEANKSAIQKRIEADFMALFDRVVDADFPFLGACSGNGLLGKYCGASISTRFAEPVGGVDVTLTENAQADPLLKGFPDSFRVLLGHKEACDEVPPGAVLLASSAACRVQMFRLRDNIYATQFHPEGDLQGFTIRINVYKNHGYFPPETADELIAKVAGEQTPYAQKLLSRFVRRYRADV